MDFSSLIQSLFGSPAAAAVPQVAGAAYPDDALRRQIAANIINRTQIARDQPYPSSAPLQAPSNAAPQNMLASQPGPQTALLAQPDQNVTVPPSPLSLPNTPPQVNTEPTLPQSAPVPTSAPSQASPLSAAMLSPIVADPSAAHLQAPADPWAQLLGAQPLTVAQSAKYGQFPAVPAAPGNVDATTTAATASPQAALASAAASSPSLWQKYQNFTRSDRGQALNAFFTGLAMGKTPQQSLAYGAQMVSATAPARQKRDQINQTAQWLQGKGMSAQDASLLASNPTALADYLKNSLGGQKPVSVGAGSSLVDPTTGKVIYQAPQNDKAASYGQSPIILTDPDGKMHMGQMSSGGGVLIDGKTYSSLPANWKVGTVSQSGSGGLSPETLDILATQYLAGDKTAIQGFSRNASMRAQLANAISKKANEMGMDGKSIAAEISAYGGNVAAQRSAGTRAAQVGMAASEANKMADVALEASQAVPRGKFLPWNAAVNAVRTGTSSPQMAAFVTATTSLVNAYARAISPLGAPTDAMRQHAEQMLNTAQSPQAYEAVIDQMKKEMGAALNAPAEISEQLKGQITGAHSAETPGATQSPATSAPSAMQGTPSKIATKAAYDALPSGTVFIAPDGTTRKKP